MCYSIGKNAGTFYGPWLSIVRSNKLPEGFMDQPYFGWSKNPMEITISWRELHGNHCAPMGQPVNLGGFVR